MRILVAGALGEVGRTVSAALVDHGHRVIAASSRAPLPGSPAVSLDAAAELVRSGEVDLVVNAAGRGDRREGRPVSSSSVRALAPVIRESGVSGVLLSTTRVLEGWERDVPEDAEPRPRSPYGEENAALEAEWRGGGGQTASVLRIANYFCAPTDPESPQAQLLPWSLVTEALATGSISVRSSGDTSREFVDAADVASALIALAQATEGRVVATVPGAVLTLAQLVESVSDAFTDAGLARPTATFGPGPAAVQPRSLTGWLAAQGWRSRLSPESVRDVVARWVGGSV